MVTKKSLVTMVIFILTLSDYHSNNHHSSYFGSCLFKYLALVVRPIIIHHHRLTLTQATNHHPLPVRLPTPQICVALLVVVSRMVMSQSINNNTQQQHKLNRTHFTRTDTKQNQTKFMAKMMIIWSSFSTFCRLL